MIKKKIINLLSIIAGCLLLIAALYVIPVQQEVTVKFTGAVITLDGDILERTDITYTEDKLNYLLRDHREDMVRISIDPDSLDWSLPPISYRQKYSTLYDPLLDLPYMAFNSSLFSKTDPNRSQIGLIAVSLEHGYFICQAKDTPNQLLIGSANGDIDPAAIMDFFSEFIDHYINKIPIKA